MVSPAAVEWIADDRVPNRGQMDSDLVGPAGRQAALDEGRSIAKSLEPPVTGFGFFAAAGHHGHLLPVAAVPSDITPDHIFHLRRHPPNDGLVRPLQAMGGELRG